MSQDPFTVVRQSLETIFQLPMRNGVYTFTEIQKLKEATDNYKAEDTASFIKLLQALRQSLPYLEKYNVDFSTIRINMDTLAVKQNLSVNWDIFLKHPKVSHKFQFNAQNQIRELELIPWIAFITKKMYAQLSKDEVIECLLENHETPGFSSRLTKHLKNDPDFLLDLIMDSESNFNKIAKTVLILYITDAQLAKAIVHHADRWIKPHINPYIEVEHFVHALNSNLSNGRSVNVLLRNNEAKQILDTSKYFQIYQSEEYEHRYAPHPRPQP